MNEIVLRSNPFRSGLAGTAFAITAVLFFVWIETTVAQTITISNLWSISTAAGRTYVTTNTTERGIAHNPATGHVLLVSRAGGDPGKDAV